LHLSSFAIAVGTTKTFKLPSESKIMNDPSSPPAKLGKMPIRVGSLLFDICVMLLLFFAVQSAVLQKKALS
jgi:hypothetical protein